VGGMAKYQEVMNVGLDQQQQQAVSKAEKALQMSKQMQKQKAAETDRAERMRLDNVESASYQNDGSTPPQVSNVALNKEQRDAVSSAENALQFAKKTSQDQDLGQQLWEAAQVKRLKVEEPPVFAAEPALSLKEEEPPVVAAETALPPPEEWTFPVLLLISRSVDDPEAYKQAWAEGSKLSMAAYPDDLKCCVTFSDSDTRKNPNVFHELIMANKPDAVVHVQAWFFQLPGMPGVPGGTFLHEFKFGHDRPVRYGTDRQGYIKGGHGGADGLPIITIGEKFARKDRRAEIFAGQAIASKENSEKLPGMMASCSIPAEFTEDPDAVWDLCVMGDWECYQSHQEFHSAAYDTRKSYKGFVIADTPARFISPGAELQRYTWGKNMTGEVGSFKDASTGTELTPEILGMMQRTARLVADNGAEFEQRILMTDAGKNKYAFLQDDHPLNDRYKAELQDYADEKRVHQILSKVDRPFSSVTERSPTQLYSSESRMATEVWQIPDEAAGKGRKIARPFSASATQRNASSHCRAASPSSSRPVSPGRRPDSAGRTSRAYYQQAGRQPLWKGVIDEGLNPTLAGPARPRCVEAHESRPQSARTTGRPGSARNTTRDFNLSQRQASPARPTTPGRISSPRVAGKGWEFLSSVR